MVDKGVVKTIIYSLHKEILGSKLIERAISFEAGMCYVLVGIRRAGKSYLMMQDIQQRIGRGEMAIEDCLFVNFEDERLAGIEASELNVLIDCYQELFGDKKPWIYLDEIQNVPGWEKFVRRLADQKFRVMVSGSNAKMLSREVATTLGGRYVVREVFPFSYDEYLKYYGIELSDNWAFQPSCRLEVVRRFSDYFYYGGFAEMFPLTGKREWINGLYQKILLGDIVARHSIRGERSIRLLARKVAENVMQPTSLSRFMNIIRSTGDKMSLPTLKDYLQLMEENYLIFSLLNFASSISEQETTKKRYYIDNGLLNNFMYKGEARLLENICAVHLFKHYHNADDPQLFFYNRNVEVDFYIPQEGWAVQVSYDVAEDMTFEREVDALVVLNKHFPLKRAEIVTWDFETRILRDGLSIDVVPVWKWILGEWGVGEESKRVSN